MKRIRVMLAALLVISTAALTATPAFAAQKKEYVSDVTTCAAKSFSDAKSKLEKNGYTALPDSNLNGTLDTGVYVGYKTTTDPDEALTDIAAMNMNGGYSASKYDDILEENRALIDSHIDELYYSISGFQENYGDERKSAIYAAKALNNYTTAYDGVRGTQLGDYFLAFDFSDNARSELVDIVMKGNAQLVMDIETLLVSAAETGSDTFVERLASTDYDTLEEQYIMEYGDPSVAAVMLETDFNETAVSIYNNWDVFADYLRNIDENYVIKNSDGTYGFNQAYFEPMMTDSTDSLSGDEAEVLRNIQDNLANVSISSGYADYSLYCMLDSIDYCGGTLLDYFMQSSHDIDVYEIYPVAWAMNDAQRSQIDIVGVRNCLVSSFADIQNRDYDGNEIMDNAAEVDECNALSVYSGVDLSIFEDGVAMTTQAEKYETLTGDNWFTSIINDNATAAEYEIGIAISSGIAVIAFATGMVCYARQVKQVEQAKEFMDTAYDIYDAYYTRYQYLIDNQIGIPRNIADNMEYDVYDKANDYETMRDAYHTAGTKARFVKCMSFAIMLIALAVDVYLIWKLISTTTKSLKEIPHHIVTAENERDMETFIYYSSIKDVAGKAADINNGEADKSKGWLVLYSTKDKRAGSPIEADGFAVQVGSSSLDSSSGIHLFGETALINLTAKNYTGYSDDIGGTYVTFRRDTKAYTASSFTGGYIAAAGGFGLALGALLGVVAGKVFGRRKEKAPSSAVTPE